MLKPNTFTAEIDVTESLQSEECFNFFIFTTFRPKMSGIEIKYLQEKYG